MPAYLRICRQTVPTANAPEYRFELGKAVTLRDGKDMTIFSTGGTVHSSLGAAKLLEGEGISARVVNIHTIKPLDTKTVLECAMQTPRLLSVEDHTIIGGMGSAIAEVLAQHTHHPLRYRIHGVPDCFGESGDPKDLYRKHRLDDAGIAAVARELYRS
jgi:transketolase